MCKRDKILSIPCKDIQKIENLGNKTKINLFNETEYLIAADMATVLYKSKKSNRCLNDNKNARKYILNQLYSRRYL